jgi:hypothetical protein
VASVDPVIPIPVVGLRDHPIACVVRSRVPPSPAQPRPVGTAIHAVFGRPEEAGTRRELSFFGGITGRWWRPIIAYRSHHTTSGS